MRDKVISKKAQGTSTRNAVAQAAQTYVQEEVSSSDDEASSSGDEDGDEGEEIEDDEEDADHSGAEDIGWDTKSQWSRARECPLNTWIFKSRVFLKYMDI